MKQDIGLALIKDETILRISHSVYQREMEKTKRLAKTLAVLRDHLID